ncbi:formyltetrahydrofolate deformylase [Arthrobacter zhaoxinii]|uniref:Formyltetrahydrofolate deformylase n=1 Tax=Arthrobacter zhaoxinii TaxID=2964616 RepID=A0ABY5YSS6_9MICC|nr:formyltetrahydrofolate deformylase [Arthrobacter zhaoxinii]UWX97880.1 formyltetrahydrofolate deformylase [Arthrobacter zhaoxinii]
MTFSIPGASAAGNGYTLTLSCPDRPGIVHAVSASLVAAEGNITESAQFGSPETGSFFMRVDFRSPNSYEQVHAELAGTAAAFGMAWELHPAGRRTRTLIMASKSGHCLNDLLFQQRAGTLPIEVPAIVSNHRDLESLADFYGVPFHHIPVTPDTKGDAENRLRELMAELDIELVVLARYMQILSTDLCRDLAGRAINIHHSFLPSFKGARPYHQAHARGVKLIGATAHYVTSDLDEGPIIEQEVIRVDHARSAAQLAALGSDVEGRALSKAVQWHAQHRVLLDGRRTIVFN